MNQDDFESKLALTQLIARVDSGFSAIDKRFDATDRELAAIKIEVKRTNGRVTTLETKDAVRVSAESSDERSPLTPAKVRVYVGLLVIYTAALLAMLKYAGALKP